MDTVDYVLCAVQEQLSCPICQTVLTDPRTTTCGHTFCHKCITQAFDAHADEQRGKEQPAPFRCPIDRRPIGSKREIQPAPFVISSLIGELEAHCPYRDRGCDFTGKRWVLEQHVRDGCGFADVVCGGAHSEDDAEDGERCERTVERRLRVEGECVHKQVSCRCGEQMEKWQLAAHKAECRASACDECGQHDEHADDCRKAVLECKGKPLGCVFVAGTRSEEDDDNNADGDEDESREQSQEPLDPPPKQLLAAHERACPLAAMAPVLSRYDDRMQSLETENKALRRTVDRLVAQTTLLHEAGGPASGRAASSYNDDDLTHMFMEIERLRTDVFHLTTATNERYLQQNTMLVHETARTNEDIALLRAGFNSVRQQLHFLLNARRAPVSDGPTLAGPAAHVKL